MKENNKTFISALDHIYNDHILETKQFRSRSASLLDVMTGITHDSGGHWECSDCGNPPITTTTTAAPSGGGCFPSTATVNSKDGRMISMSELQIGDSVQIGIFS